MQRSIRRLILAILAGGVLSAFTAAPALATTVTTGPATRVTTTTAVLTGAIDTGGQATAWQFQWGKTAAYGHGSTLQTIPAGNGIVSVSSQAARLSPDTKYYFRLVATTGTGTTYYPLNVTFGNGRTFTTKATGKLLLLSGHLVITNGFLFVPLRCSSDLACTGRFTISTRAKLQHSKALATVLCATTFFNIRKHKTATIKVRARGGCLALLRSSPHQSHTAKLTSNPRTGQKALIKTVVLVLG